MSEPNLNPYAPSRVVHLGAQKPSAPDGHSAYKTSSVITMTGLGVIASGAVFGALLMLVPILTVALSGSGITETAGMLILAPIAALVGAVIAAVAAFPVILFAWLFTIRMFVLTPGWTPRATKRFASACGFLTGFFSFMFLSGFNLYGAPFALLPGIVGSLVTGIFVNITVLHRVPLLASGRRSGCQLPSGGTLPTEPVET